MTGIINEAENLTTLDIILFLPSIIPLTIGKDNVRIDCEKLIMTDVIVNAMK